MIMRLFALWAGLGLLTAQSPRTTISGSIQDLQGRPAAGARISVESLDRGTKVEIEPDRNGGFQVLQLPVGAYRVRAEAGGYLTQTQDVTLTVGEEVQIRIVLPPAGQGQQRLEVQGAVAPMRTDPSAGGQVLNQQVVSLPLDGRNYYDLSLLLPGVTPPAQGSAGSVRGDFAVSVNGGREDGNNFLLDGVYNGDPKLNGVGVTSPVDAIREFEVSTASYDASHGRNASGQISVVLKSGSNGFHGTAYEFFRNDNLDARNFFAPAGEPDPRYQRNQFGGSLGGPVVKDRTFFFVDYEGRRVNEGIARRTNVPTALERNGDFSRSPGLFAIDLFTGQPFPGNVIPANRIHPVGRNLGALYPMPNRGAQGQNYSAAPVSRDRSHTFDVRMDHQLSRGADLTARYSFGDRDFFEPYAGQTYAQIPGFGNNVPRRGQNAMVGYTQALSPAAVNELRAAFNRVAIGVFQQNQNNDLNSQVGLPNVSTRERDRGLSFVSLVGWSPLGDEFNNPQESVTNTYQIADQFTMTTGANTIKFGGEIRKLEQNAYRDVQARGLINFVGFTGNALAEMLQGFPAVTGVARLDNPQHLRTESYNLFVQFNRRVTSSFTMHLGLRYEYNDPAVDADDRANLYDPSAGNVVPVGQGSMPRAGYTADRNNLGPRAGFAWAPGEGNTVLRGGYGIYFDQSSLAPSEGLYFNQPYFDFRLFVASAQFPLTLSDPFPANYPLRIPGSAFSFQRDLRTPYTQHWNFMVQRQLGSSTVLEAGYVGTKGTKLYAARDINQPAPSPNSPNLRPNFFFDDINQLASRANSNYHSLQTTVRRRMSRGVSLIASYTLGKSIDDASGFFSSAGDANFPMDSRNVGVERARSGFDVRQRLVASYSWILPSPRGGMRFLLGGWQTHGIWTFQTGRPFTVALPSELDQSNTGRTTLGFGANDRPNLVGDPRAGGGTPERWFNPAAFALPAFGTFGNAGRNILDGPGLASLNLAVHKVFPMSESVNLQFRAEAFNALNRANFNQPEIFLGGAGFAAISSAQNPRLLQLGLKLVF